YCPVSIVTDPPPAERYPRSLHDALPISRHRRSLRGGVQDHRHAVGQNAVGDGNGGMARMHHPQEEEQKPEGGSEDGTTGREQGADRKSTRLNSSHVKISYAVFCLKKKTE